MDQFSAEKTPCCPGQFSVEINSNVIQDDPLHTDIASWRNRVEGFSANLTKRKLKRGAFRSDADLQAAINRFREQHNRHGAPSPCLPARRLRRGPRHFEGRKEMAPQAFVIAQNAQENGRAHIYRGKVIFRKNTNPFVLVV